MLFRSDDELFGGTLVGLELLFISRPVIPGMGGRWGGGKAEGGFDEPLMSSCPGVAAVLHPPGLIVNPLVDRVAERSVGVLGTSFSFSFSSPEDEPCGETCP